MSVLKSTITASLLVAFLLVFGGSAAWAQAKDAKVLHVVTEAWPPYVYEEEGLVKGIDYEVTKAVLAELGYRLNVELMPWKRSLLLVETGERDAVMDASRTADRERSMQFPSEPLSLSQSVLFFRKDDPFRYQGIDSLAGKEVAVSLGYLYTEAFDTGAHFERVRAPTHESGFLMLLNNRVDAYVVNRRVGSFVASRMKISEQVTADTTPVSGGEVFLAFSKSTDPAFVKQFSDELRRFKQTDAYQKILSAYGVTEN